MNSNDKSMLTLYISTNGKDTWSGKLAEPDINGNDGPLATLEGARDVIRSLKARGKLFKPVKVLIREGRYAVNEPVVFTEKDSWPVSYEAYPGEKVIFDGGIRITGWQEETRQGITVWRAEIPEVAAGKWYFRQLFVNGERRKRTRLPKKGYYQMEGAEGIRDEDDPWSNLFKGSYAFKYREGDIGNWRNIEDIDIVADHFWVDERMPVCEIDKKSRTIRSRKRSVFILKDDVTYGYSKYFMENIYEALSEPGEWYLDRTDGKIYYIPMPGESLDSVKIVAPYVTQFIKIVGNPDKSEFVDFLGFKNLNFCYSDWYQPDVTKAYDIEGLEKALNQGHNLCTTPQSATHVPGVIYLEGARYCSIEGCRIEHIGWYGIEISDGCTGINISCNEICDMGAGGIRINGSNAEGPVCRRTGNNTITDNHIHSGGHVFRNGTAILSMHSFGNDISHNHIHDFYYIGISCGWNWGYKECISKDNRIEKNYIHHLGHGVMSDLGGIYTLGVQPGTVIRGNIIHDIVKKNYGGRGIYLDEGSAHILVEDNICIRVSSHPFLVHYGRENIVRNNIFGLGGEGQVNLIRSEGHNAFTFEGNIVLTDGKPVFTGENPPGTVHRYISHRNLIWDVSGKEALCGYGQYASDTNWHLKESYKFSEWQDMGYEIHSLVANPMFTDLERMDFSFAEGSPAHDIGFKSIDTKNVGPRKDGGIC